MLTRPSRLYPLLLLGGLYLGLSLLLRLLLWFFFGRDSGVGAIEIPAILALGAVNDAVELVYLMFPLTLYLMFCPQRWHESRLQRALLWAMSFTAIFGMIYLAAMEYFFFEEFDARFNRVAVDYLVSPHEVLGNIYESYPVAWYSLAIAVVSLVMTWLLWPAMRRSEQPLQWRRRLGWLAAHATVLLAASSFYSSDTLAFSENRVSNELAANGLSSFFNALRTNRLEYEAFYRTGDRARMLTLLRQDLADGGGAFVGDDLTRRFPERPEGLGRLNVVVLAQESFGAEFVGAYGDTRGLTPEFDALAKQGLLFRHTYASGTRTVRGLEAMTASLPPTPSESVVKRPGNERVVTWGEVMQKLGYHNSFLYGGYGYFDNMNAYFSANGAAVSDRNDIPNPSFSNIWGVADEDLMRHAIDYYDERAREGRPFFSLIMSTSNHKPYTFPAGIPGVPEKKGGRLAGVRYADYAIGQFFREAAKHEWYKDTLFVVMADHGARVYGAAEIPLYSYEIPFLILAPGRLAPGRVDTLTAQIDLAPIVMGLLGLPYEAPFFGRDVLHYPDPDRVLLFNHNQKVALARGDELAILGLRQSAETVRHWRDPSLPLKKQDQYARTSPDPALIDLATAYYQIASDFYQNHRYQP